MVYTRQAFQGRAKNIFPPDRTRFSHEDFARLGLQCPHFGPFATEHCLPLQFFDTQNHPHPLQRLRWRDFRSGTTLGFPHSSGINGSRHGHMRELRTQHGGRPFRTLYAFDPRRNAILLIGGDKTGDNRWYETHVPIADHLYDEHLQELRKEGLIDE
jgi:hypothetical protein